MQTRLSGADGWVNCAVRTIMILTLDDNSPILIFSYIAIYQTAFLASNQDFCIHLTENGHATIIDFARDEGVAPLPRSQYCECSKLNNV